VFHERVLRLPAPAAEVLRLLAATTSSAATTAADYPELGNAVLVCATSCGRGEIAQYAQKARPVIAAVPGAVPGPAKF